MLYIVKKVTTTSTKNKKTRSIKNKPEFFWKDSSIKKDLQQFYDKEAKKYYETRKKYWKDAEYLLEALQNFKGKKIRILEFGCGSGRFASYLSQHYQGDFDYIGVDLSQKLIDFAQKELPDFSFICWDISTFVLEQEQESFDIIVGTSSFQHIPNPKERLFLMKYFYGLLKYEGALMMINRSFSQRFFRTYWKQCMSSFGKWVISFWKKSWRDIMVPRTNNGTTSYRFYHLFWLKELKKLSDFSGFSLSQLSFIDKEGNLISKEKKARSSLFIAKKKTLI